MGTKERHTRERQSVRMAILTAARDLFVAEGYRNVSMRKIAQRIEYSPAAIYSYFESKDDIFFALAEEGFHRMCDGLAAALDGDGDPLDMVRAGFWSYYRFSREQPQFFELMFVDRTVPQIGRRWDRFAFVAEMMFSIGAAIERTIDAGALPRGTDPQAAVHVLWAAVHGPAVLAVCGRLAPAEDPDALARDTLEAAIAGLRAGVRSTFVPEAVHARSATSAAETTDVMS